MFGYVRLLLDLLPIAIAVVVERNDEVVDVLRFRRALAENNTATGVTRAALC